MNRIIPYVYRDDWTVPDRHLVKIYNALVKDKTASRIFFDGSINSPEGFVAAIRSPDVIPIVFYMDDYPVGFAWLNGLTKTSAFAHFAFIKKAWGDPARDFGHRSVDYWMSFTKDDGSPMFQVILGTIPAVNRRAVRYVHDLGFKSCGVIPNLLVGADGNYHSAEMVYYERV